MTTPPVLTSPRSDRVRAVASLGRRSARSRHGVFLVEGPQGVIEAIRHRPGAVREVYVLDSALTPGAPAPVPVSASLAEAARSALEAGLRVVPCSGAVLAAMGDATTPQGVLAVCDRAAAGLDATLTEALDAAVPGPGGRAGFVVVLTQVRDPGNAGTVIRGADAAGAGAVVVSAESVDVTSPKVVRSTVGSLFHLPVTTGHAWADIEQACRARGIRLVAADGRGARLLPDAAGLLRGPHAWVMGNEAHGLDPAVRGACDDVVAVPLYGQAESLNLAMAATVCLYGSAAAQRLR